LIRLGTAKIPKVLISATAVVGVGGTGQRHEFLGLAVVSADVAPSAEAIPNIHVSNVVDDIARRQKPRINYDADRNIVATATFWARID
jgi:hypothetical protein